MDLRIFSIDMDSCTDMFFFAGFTSFDGFVSMDIPDSCIHCMWVYGFMGMRM